MSMNGPLTHADAVRIARTKKDAKYFGKSQTRQSEAKYADINVIMAKYQKTGVLPPATRSGFFADVSSVGDYRDALNRVEAANDYFLHLPPDVRLKFKNDPAEFLDFVSDASNLAELEEMGIIAKSDEDVPNVAPQEEPAREELVTPAEPGS